MPADLCQTVDDQKSAKPNDCLPDCIHVHTHILDKLKDSFEHTVFPHRSGLQASYKTQISSEKHDTGICRQDTADNNIRNRIHHIIIIAIHCCKFIIDTEKYICNRYHASRHKHWNQPQHNNDCRCKLCLPCIKPVQMKLLVPVAPSGNHRKPHKTYNQGHKGTHSQRRDRHSA